MILYIEAVDMRSERTVSLSIYVCTSIQCHVMKNPSLTPPSARKTYYTAHQFILSGTNLLHIIVT